MQSEARETNKQLKRIADELHEMNRLKRREQDAAYSFSSNAWTSLRAHDDANHGLDHASYGEQPYSDQLGERHIKSLLSLRNLIDSKIEEIRRYNEQGAGDQDGDIGGEPGTGK